MANNPQAIRNLDSYLKLSSYFRTGLVPCKRTWPSSIQKSSPQTREIPEGQP